MKLRRRSIAEGGRMLRLLAMVAILLTSFSGVVHPAVAQAGTSNIAIVTTQGGQPFYDACFVLVDYSNEGCDANRDGKITFDAIPHGTYILRQTVNLGSGRFVADTTITVTGAADADGWERFYVSVVSGSDGSANGPIDISLITRDPMDARLLTDTCYVLVGYSNEGCDANADGQVTFAAIPAGTYTVRQTKTPAGYPAVKDFEINVVNVDNIPLGFVVRQAEEQNAPDSRNVSVVLVDNATKTRVILDICVQLVGASIVGCDEDLRDGQIDFLDVPAGTWELEFSNIPVGWVIDPEGNAYGPIPPLTVDASAGALSHQIVFIPVGLPSSAGVSAPEGSTFVSTSEMRPMSITATTCNLAGEQYSDCEWEIGAKFTVTTLSGEFIGSCVLEGDRNTPMYIAGAEQCRVDIPIDVQVVVTLDTSTIPTGYTPEQNPLYFEWPQMAPSYVGVRFSIVPE